MTLKLVPPASPRSSRVKACAYHAFRLVRVVQAKAAQAPGVIARAATDVREAWVESARPNV